MKKRILIAMALALAALFTFSACAAPNEMPSCDVSYWQDNPAPSKTEDGYFVEESVYKIDLVDGYKPDPLLGENYPMYASGSGTYITRIKWKEGAETVVETELYFTHKMKSGELVMEEELTDVKKTSTSFKSAMYNLYPTKSTATTKMTIYYSNSDTAKIGFKQIDFFQEITYNDDYTAAATLFGKNPQTGAFDVAMQRSPSIENSTKTRPTEYRYKGLDKKIVFDNSMLYYGLRALDIPQVNSLRKSINVIDVFANKVMALSMVENTGTGKVLSVQLHQVTNTDDVWNVTDTPTQAVNLRVSAYTLSDGKTSENNSIKLWYSALKPVNGGHNYLVQMQQGQLLYTLQQVNGSPITQDSDIG